MMVLSQIAGPAKGHNAFPNLMKRKEKRTMKRIVSLLLCVLMIVGLFAGCNNDKPTPTNPPATQGGDKPTAGKDPEPTQPAEPVKLTIWIKGGTKVADYNDNAMTTWLEEQGNFDLEITSIPSADFSTKINLALTVGAVEELPDIIIGTEKNAATIMASPFPSSLCCWWQWASAWLLA